MAIRVMVAIRTCINRQPEHCSEAAHTKPSPTPCWRGFFIGFPGRSDPITRILEGVVSGDRPNVNQPEGKSTKRCIDDETTPNPN